MSEIKAFLLEGHTLTTRPAPLSRDWMDQSNQRFAYRCLPLNIANAHGWEILCDSPFRARWNGEKGKNAVSVVHDMQGANVAMGHFGEGVLTFHVPAIFMTDIGTNLYVTGPVNRPKDGIQPLSAIVETDWSPYTFTMNWIFTRPHHTIRFEKGEPFCHIFPVQLDPLEAMDAKMLSIATNPEMKVAHEKWSKERLQFNADLHENNPESEAVKVGWQKEYFKGKNAPTKHRSKLKLKPFT